MRAQHRYRQPLREPITPGRTVANGYMHWFYENGKPLILIEEERARVIRGHHPKRPRQQCGPRSTGASSWSRQRTQATSSYFGPVPAAEGPSTEPYTPMPPFSATHRLHSLIRLWHLQRKAFSSERFSYTVR
ncbi:hypothetical protein V6N13_065415 [Hibiscus sabdariffa]